MVEYNDDEWDVGEEYRGDQISVFSGGLMAPIGTLVAQLVDDPPRSHPDTVGERENGHCVAIISLLFLVFESFVGRAGHLRKLNTGKDRDAKVHAHTIPFLKDLAPNFPEQLLNELAETYVLRDAIAHAHVWTIEYVIRESGTHITGTEKHPGYGNRRLDAMADANTARTVGRNLRVIPTNIGLQEVHAVFNTLRAVLKHLVAAGALETAAVRRGIRYRNHRHFEFWALDTEIATIIEKRANGWALMSGPQGSHPDARAV